jgi:radical SAM superfamily enzyme YgiQ (UPF0313 family)
LKEKKRMKILLVHPKMGHGPITDQDRGTLRAKLLTNPTMTVPAVAAAIPRKHTVRIILEDDEDIDFSEQYGLVGVSCFTMYAVRAYEIADEFRKRGVPVVLGGYHASALPEEAKEHADAVVIGEAELSLPHLLHDFENGKLQPFYHSTTLVKPEDIPPLRRDLLTFRPLTDGLRVTRGCTHTCDFCSITYFFGHTFRKRPIKNVINELKSISSKLILIHDANLTADVDYAKALFRAMVREKTNKRWLANGNINVLGRDKDFLQLARKAGCIGWTIGIESVCQESLNGVKKFANKVDKYTHWIQMIRKHGMAINGLLIFGFDQDTPDVFDKTLQALNEWEIDAGEFNILTPLPGTPLFDQMEKEGRILTKDWSQYTQTKVVFQPKNMTPKELYDGTQRVVREFHSPVKMLQRVAGLIKLSFTPSTMLLMSPMDFSRRIWYKREFNFG